MNYIKTYENYHFTKVGYSRRGRSYIFDTEKWSYKVSVLDNQSNPSLPYVGFKAKSIGKSDIYYDMSVITNDNIYKVMSTIREILIDDNKRNDNSGYTFSFIGDKSKSNQRLGLYKRVFKEWNILYDEDNNQFNISE